MSLPPLPPLVMAETAQKLLLEWGAAIREAALEEAAKAVEDLVDALDRHKWPSPIACAAAIRALKATSSPPQSP